VPRRFADHSRNSENVAPAPRLVGWKDIAAYLGKAERTVKRWGKDRGLPIHRVPGGASASVYAYPVELDKWLAASKLAETEAAESSQQCDAGDELSSPAAGADAVVASAPAQAANAGWPIPTKKWAAVFGGFLLAALALSIVVSWATGVRLPRAVHLLFTNAQVKAIPLVASTVTDAEKVQAHTYYLMGRYEWNQRTAESLNHALDFFTQAIVHDPGDAQAYAGLADTYDLLREYSTMPDTAVFPRAIAAARKAVELDDSLSEAHRALAFAEMYGDWNFADAEKEFRRAIELNPNDAQAHRWYANAFAVPGRFQESLKEIEKAQELDPSSHATLADKGWMLFDAGRTDEAVETLKEVERSAPGFRSPHYYMMVISIDLQDYPTYLAEGQKTAEIVHDPVLADIIASARAGYAKAGARGLLDGLYTRQKEYYLQGKVEGTMLAKTCALMGRKQEAIELLEKSYSRHETNVFACLSHPDLLTLRDDPRYRALVKKINFPTHQTESSVNVAADMGARPLRNSSDAH
jgi:tetratricopeptide (TPR) repeat protein